MKRHLIVTFAEDIKQNVESFSVKKPFNFGIFM